MIRTREQCECQARVNVEADPGTGSCLGIRRRERAAGLRLDGHQP